VASRTAHESRRFDDRRTAIASIDTLVRKEAGGARVTLRDGPARELPSLRAVSIARGASSKPPP
jgi:hypothetical protein